MSGTMTGSPTLSKAFQDAATQYQKMQQAQAHPAMGQAPQIHRGQFVPYAQPTGGLMGAAMNPTQTAPTGLMTNMYNARSMY